MQWSGNKCQVWVPDTTTKNVRYDPEPSRFRCGAHLTICYYGVSRSYRDSSSQTTEFTPRFRSAQATSTRLKYSITRFTLRTSFTSINAAECPPRWINALHSQYHMLGVSRWRRWETVLNYDWNDWMKTMITRVCDIKIIVNPIIRKIIVQTEWDN